ncbi:hypothetical protein [Intrasporangium flavum]|uniref:hypothetical protein n=1 Tax=Intrasporangium flavum TaxID=1428657 RepID=UPI001F61A8D8|nr:hypothetical protein [Intrasporangium flavum]
MLGGLGVAAVAGGGWALASVVGPERPVTMTPESSAHPAALDRSALRRRTAIGDARHVYEVDGRATPYYVQDAFAATLAAWMTTHRTLTGQRPDALHSYGGWTQGAGTSWHHSGQALDIARLRTGGADVASLRYDRWRDDTAAEVRRRLRTYWQVAAGLHLHFADVLTYLFDASHSNHIHVDSGRFGPGGVPRLIPRSGAQVQAIQAMCVHVWGRTGVQTSGELDGPTRDATTAILRDHGGTGELTDGVEAWQAFLRATIRQARDA